MGRKKKTPPKGGQGQSTPPATSNFPKFEDFGKELQDLLREMSGVPPTEKSAPKQEQPEPVIMEPEVLQNKGTYPIKNMEEGEMLSTTPAESVLPVNEVAVTAPNVKSDKVRGSRRDLSLTPQTLVQGIIMSEILQPPRAKRPYRR